MERTMTMQRMDTLYSLYANMMESRNPNSTSCILYFDGEKYISTTYEVLDRAVNLIAKEVDQFCHLSNQVCGLICQSGTLLPSLCLGLLKISAAFAILDLPNLECSIRNFMKYVDLNIILADEKLYDMSRTKLCQCWSKQSRIHTEQGSILVFQNNGYDCCGLHGDNGGFGLQSRLANRVHGLAYVVQTSGTTGAPKIVQVPHRCIVPNIIHFRSLFQAKDKDVILSVTPLTFDPFIVEMFLALVTGATLVFIRDFVKLMSVKLSSIISACHITILQLTPSMLKSFDVNYLRGDLLGQNSNMRILALGGEKCLTRKKLKFFKHPRNKTRMFNLYGITELSCWAMVKEITLEKGVEDEEVSLGLPLLATSIEVKDDSGAVISTGTGELYIGGTVRYCVVNAEPPSYGKMIPTGDIVNVSSDGKLYFQGRKDDMVKYHGKKIHLSLLNKTLEAVEGTLHHVLQLHEDKLYIFVIKNEICAKEEEELKSQICQELRSKDPNLPPLHVIFVLKFPLTSHGKIDFEKLIECTKQNRKRKLEDGLVNEETVVEFFTETWKTHTGQENVQDTDNFILKGGDSITAVQFAFEIEEKFNERLFSEVMNILVNEDFKALVEYAKKNFLSNPIEERNRKKSKQESEESGNGASSLTTSGPTKENFDVFLCYETMSRRGYNRRCFCDTCFKDGAEFPTTEPELADEPPNTALTLDIAVEYDLKKCVDASPLIVHFTKSKKAICYIGSHSGNFVAINIENGITIWEIVLPNRIESSACISACGLYVLVGCYDGCMYCLNSQTGITHWKFETRGEIKCSPNVSQDNVAFIGSHDQHLYAVNVKDGTLAWHRKVGNGSIFASPAIGQDYVCSATLDGIVAFLDINKGTILYNDKEEQLPYFSSPLILGDSIYIGSVNGSMLCFDKLPDLIERRSLSKHKNPIFSCPFYNAITKSVVWGSHSQLVESYSLENDSTSWTFKADSPVYATSSCFVFEKSPYVVTVSTDGTLYILSAKTGKKIYSKACPGELFSSPAVFKNYIAFGCRNNHLYVYKLNSNK